MNDTTMTKNTAIDTYRDSFKRKNGTSDVRPPSRGYKYKNEYEKYYRGQLNNVKNLQDFVEYAKLLGNAREKGHIDPIQSRTLYGALASRTKTIRKKLTSSRWESELANLSNYIK
jgi:hypothetical protein